MRDGKLIFGTNLDPEALVANTPKFLGDVIDTSGDTFYKSLAGTYTKDQNRELGTGNPIYVVVGIGAVFSPVANKTIQFHLGHDETLAAGNLAAFTALASSPVLTAADVVAGDIISFDIPSGVELQRYIQIAVESSVNAGNESGRFSSWIELFNRSNKFYSEGQVWA